MSRIHEALKKAEQERAASQGGTAQPSFIATPVADPPGIPGGVRRQHASASVRESDADFWKPVQRGWIAGSVSTDGLETGPADHAVHEWR